MKRHRGQTICAASMCALACTARATCSGFIHAASVLQMKGLKCDGYAVRVNSVVVAVFENITTLMQLNQIFEMTSACNERTDTKKKKRTLQEQLTNKQDPTCEKMQTQLQRGRNHEMFVATWHMCRTFFFEHGKHPCQHVVHQKWLRHRSPPSKKKRDGQFLPNKFTANNSSDRGVPHACQHVVMRIGATRKSQKKSKIHDHHKWL